MRYIILNYHHISQYHRISLKQNKINIMKVLLFIGEKKRAPKVRLYTFISLSIQITLGFGNINIHCEFPKNLIFLT